MGRRCCLLTGWAKFEHCCYLHHWQLGSMVCQQASKDFIVIAAIDCHFRPDRWKYHRFDQCYLMLAPCSVLKISWRSKDLLVSHGNHMWFLIPQIPPINSWNNIKVITSLNNARTNSLPVAHAVFVHPFRIIDICTILNAFLFPTLAGYS